MRGPLTRPTLVMIGASGADRTDRSTAISAEHVARLLSELRGVDAIREAVILSTCHRLETYLVADDESGAVEAVVGRGLGCWHATGSMAASHLLRVACGLDSPILGESLTAREMEVLRLLAAGSSNQAIARELIVELGTVKRHVSNIMDKLQVQSRLEAVVRARDLGIV